jgi:hypothetical protein
MKRSLESKPRGAMKFLNDGTREEPKTKHRPSKSSKGRSWAAPSHVIGKTDKVTTMMPTIRPVLLASGVLFAISTSGSCSRDI